MKRKGLLISLISLTAAIIVSAGLVYASWTGVWKTETNTVTIGQPVKVEIGGNFGDNVTIMPNTTVSGNFTLDLTDADFASNDYALKISDVNSSKALTYGESVAVWQYSFDGSTFYDLTSTGGAYALGLISTDEAKTLTIKLGDVDTDFAGGTLTFTLEITVTAK